MKGVFNGMISSRSRHYPVLQCPGLLLQCPITVSPHNVLQHLTAELLIAPNPLMVRTLHHTTQTIFLICSLKLAFTRLFAAIIPPFFIICIHFCVNYDLRDFCWKLELDTKVKWTANNFQIECGEGEWREPRVRDVSELSFIAREPPSSVLASQMHKKVSK